MKSSAQTEVAAAVGRTEMQAPPRFVDGITGIADQLPGHGDSLNASFLRPRSQLTIVFVIDGDDCSVRDYALFGDDTRFASTPAVLRCAEFGADEDVVQPLERHHSGLAALRAFLSDLNIAILAGFPIGSELDVTEMLTRPGMQVRLDGHGASHGPATPPRRIAELGLAYGQLSSICAESYAPFFGWVDAEVAATSATQ